MRNYLVISFVGFLFGATLGTQSSARTTEPDSGSVMGNFYSHQFFGISWEFPKDWVASQEPGLGRKNHSDSPLILLVLVPARPQSGEMIGLSAHDFRTASGFDVGFMDLVRTLLEKQSWQSLNNHGYYTIGGGVPAHREDFQSSDTPPKYAAVLAGPLRGYELEFLVQAGSTQRVDELVKEVLAIKIAPDWKAVDHDWQIAPRAAISKRVRVSAQVLQSIALRKVPPEYPTESRQTGLRAPS